MSFLPHNPRSELTLHLNGGFKEITMFSKSVTIKMNGTYKQNALQLCIYITLTVYDKTSLLFQMLYGYIITNWEKYIFATITKIKILTYT